MPWARLLILMLSLVLPASFHFSGVILVIVSSLIPVNVMAFCVNSANAAHVVVSLVVIVSLSTPDESEDDSVDFDRESNFDFGSSDEFGQIVNLVLSHGFIAESMNNLYAVGRSWSVRQPAAKKAVRGILAATEIRTSVQRVDVLSALVPLALC